MHTTSASRPAMFSETMRRVTLEKLRAKANCPNRRSQSSGCHDGGDGLSAATASITTGVAASSALRLASGCVRSSNGQNRRLFQKAVRDAFRERLLPQARGAVSRQTAHAVLRQSGFLETVSDPVEGFDHLEFVVDD